MKKILFPTEFAPHAPEVFQHALELAKRFKAKIVVLHALGKPDNLLKSKKTLQQKTAEVMDQMMELVQLHKTEVYEHVEIEYIVESDFPANAILKVALDENIDLIVMGMTGKTDAIKDIFGSVSSAVLAQADAPVLLIPRGWKYRWFHKIVYATDFAFRDIGALNYLKKMAKVLNSEIDCIHIVEKGEDVLRAEINMNMLKETFQNNLFKGFDVVEGNLVKAINDYLDEENAGMMVMLSRKRGVWARLREIGRTKEMAKKIRLPLLVFKENAYENVGWKIDLTGFIPA